MPDRSKGRGQMKCNLWSSSLGVGPEDAGNRFVQNVGNDLPDFMASDPKNIKTIFIVPARNI
jgi:hypothetical protein